MKRAVTAIAVCLMFLECRRNERTVSGPNATNPTATNANEHSSTVGDGEPQSSPVDPVAAASLKAEITSVRSQIAASESESARYSGGLVKALIESRVQTLKQTLVMLEQRDKAWTFGLRLSYTIDGKAFALPPEVKDQLPQVENELRELTIKIDAQTREVSRYSGGLVHALSLSTLETMKQTEAMLNQRRLAIRYELPQYLAFQGAQAASTESTNVPSALSSSGSPAEDWEIVSVASRPGESNSSWTKFAWKLTIRNRGQYSQKFDATVEFRDSDGFPVDSARVYDLVVPANAQETFTGEKLIDASQVSRISTTAAKVKKDS
jgi:hypothetical protein